MLLVFASANKNKIIEINELIPKTHSIIGLRDIGIVDEIPEPGITIKENSFLKANYVRDFLKRKNENHAVFADDSGLEVEALNNGPGVYSARYAGLPKNDEANNKKLLYELSNVNNRNAKFVSVITLILENKTYYFEGEIKGTITRKQLGAKGFGYDPLFIPEGFNQTFAELSSDIKNKISHRAVAINKLNNFLKTV
ncbi:MAG: RdgB/HAM1 family non-canonical purine NTP pyrophosphatase [Bacteroidota bacterium]|nr:RdgB/HAM1 family non-canonical purine NTP pyrophosphatase [Bacteroidota bacterium]